MDLKGSSDGFLLIEMMMALTLSLFLFGIGIYWKNSILTLYQETQNRIEAMQYVHNLLDEMQFDPILASKLNFNHEEIQVKWQLENANVDSNHLQFPFITPPKNFRLIKLEASWPGTRIGTKIRRSTTLYAGVLL